MSERLFLERPNVGDEGVDLLVRQTLDRFHDDFPLGIDEAGFDGLEGLLVGELGLKGGFGKIIDAKLVPHFRIPLAIFAVALGAFVGPVSGGVRSMNCADRSTSEDEGNELAERGHGDEINLG